VADRFTIVTHVRRFLVQGERQMITAARQLERADAARARATNGANTAQAQGVRVGAAYTRALHGEAAASTTAARAANRHEQQIEELNRAQQRSLVTAGRMQERARTTAMATQRQERRAATAAARPTRPAATSAAAGAAVAGGAIGGGTKGLLGAGIGAATAFGIAGAVRSASQYEAALRDVGAVANVSGKKLEDLGKIVRKVGLASAAGSTEAAKAAGELVKGGLTVQDVGKGALRAALDLGRAGDVAMEDSANTVARAISTFKLAGSDAEHVADLFANAAINTTASVNDLVFSFQQGALAGKLMNYSIDETMLALATLAKAGLQNSDAGTSFKSMMVQLNAPSKQAQETINRLNLELYDAQGHFKGVGDLADELNSKLHPLSHEALTHAIKGETSAIKDLNDQQTVAALRSLAGTDGFRAMAAIMDMSGKGADALAKKISKEGEAHRIATKRLEGAEGAMKRFAAAREEVSNLVGLPLLKPFEQAASSVIKVLQKKEVRREFKELGDYLGEQGQALADGFDRAVGDGTIEKDLEAFTTAAKTVGDVLAQTVKIAGAANAVFTAIPKPVRDAATAFLIYASAARVAGAVTGRTFTGGLGPALGRGRYWGSAAGGAAAGGAAAGGAPRLSGAFGPAGPAGGGAANPGLRSAWAQNRTLVAQQRDLAARREVAERRMALSQTTVRQARGNLAQVSAFAGATPAQIASRRAALEAARAERSALAREARQLREDERRANESTRRTRLANLGRAAPRPSRGAVGIVAAGGVAGAALGGGNIGQSMLAGAAVGSIAGPWGAVGTAIAAGAGAGLVKFFQGQGKKEAHALGEEIARGAGRGMEKPRQRRIADLVGEARKQREKDIADARAQANAAQRGRDVRRGSGGLNRPVPLAASDIGYTARNRAQFQAAGRSSAFGTQKRLARKEVISVRDVAGLTRASLGDADPVMRAAGGRSMIQWLRGMEGKKGVLKGDAKKLAEELGLSFGGGFGKKADETIKSVDIRDALGKAVGGQKRDLQKQLNANFKKYTGLELPVKLTYANTAEEGRKQLRKLEEKIPDFKKGSKGRKELIEDAYQLRKSLQAFSKDSLKAVDKWDKSGPAAIGRGKPVIDATRVSVDKLTRSYQNLADAAAAAASAPTVTIPGSAGADAFDTGGGDRPPRRPTRRRRGGRLPRFGTGGGVPSWVSPGEQIFSPGGYSLGYVPGAPAAADNVFAMLPPGGTVVTGHGQALMAAGMSLGAAAALQAPHFVTGGSIGPARTGQAAYAHGLRGNDLRIAIAVAGAESGWKPGAIGENKNQAGQVVSKDYGLWQINNKAHPTYDTGRLLEVAYNAKAMSAISSHGHDWTPWSAYKNDAYKRYLTTARNAAMKAAGGSGEFGGASYLAPIMLGKSKGRAPLIEDAYGAAFARATGGMSTGDERRYGYGIIGQVRDAYQAAAYTRELEAKGGGTDAGTVSDTAVKGAKPGFGPIMDKLRSEFSTQLYVMSGSRPGSRVAGTGVLSNHSTGNAVDISTPGVANRTQGNPAPKNHVLDKVYARLGRISRPPRRDLLWRTMTGGNHYNHVHLGMDDSVVGTKAAGKSFASGLRRGGRVRAYGAGGRIRRYAGGGKVPSLRQLATPERASTSKSYLKLLIETIDAAAFGYILRVRKSLTKEYNAAGTKASRARIGGLLATIDDRLGQRAGERIARVQGRADAAAHNVTAFEQIARIRGMDTSSPEYLRSLRAQEGRSLLTEKQDRRALTKSVEEARGYEARKTAREELRKFEEQTRETKASMAELEVAAQEAARAQAEAAADRRLQFAAFTPNRGDDIAELRRQAAADRGTAWGFALKGDHAKREEYDLLALGKDQQAADMEREQQREDRRAGLQDNDVATAMALLTPSGDDDAAALLERDRIFTRALADAQAKGDKEDIAAIATELAGIRQQAAADAKAAQASLEDLTKELISQQERTQRLIQSQDLASILAGVVSGHIGSSIVAQSGFPTPVRY
jgi:TP901 family phage tail tape measure protein